ncbi:flagellar brake protein [Deltaproteobacteria bacterium OttesenSCG-928-K17]|nr:flagellar brake protein [Deltaproteobacteria bacterium OttesenSCG-928-K17]
MSNKKNLLPDALVAGTSLRLLALETTKSKWTTVIIGARPGRFIVVEMPKMAGAPVKLDEGTRWAVNFINKGAVYSFNTEVLGYTFRMVPLLFLSYPDEVEVSNLRNEKRYPVNIPLSLVVTEAPPENENVPENTLPVGLELRALVVDISEGGFMMAAPAGLPVETVVDITFHLPKDESITGIKAVVRTSRGGSAGHLMGLAYTPDISPETADRLTAFIASIENMPLRL